MHSTIFHMIASDFIKLALILGLARPILAQAEAVPTVETASKDIVDGNAPGIIAKNLPPEQIVRFHVLRCFEKWQNSDGQWGRVPITLHAWADFKVDASGSIDINTAMPTGGVYSKPDPLALLRNGLPDGDPRLDEVNCRGLTRPSKPSDEVFVELELNNEIVANTRFRIVDSGSELTLLTIAEENLHGVFCLPNESGGRPVVISLHGSEGGSLEKVRQRAKLFASHGYACLAVNYFARTYEGIEGLRAEHENVPLEIIESARDWLAKQEKVNVKRICLYGSSKGAEFALLAGTKYDWINSIIAVVPSDVVWEGYRDDGGEGTRTSSWSFQGKPLPYVRLFDFEPANEGVYRTNTERYLRSRAFYAEDVPAARIEVEKIKAKVLLIAADRDEVWASGDMTRNIVEQFAAAGKSDNVRAVIYPLAGHMITGTGTFPIYLYGVQSTDPMSKNLAAEGEATADAWRRTLQALESLSEP
jgi:dienelactone hydrolase